ncbi:MAG: hypothetical protein ACR2MX_09955 [Cyclobacteriaceae bacterium]
MDKLEKYITGNRDAFDDKQPSDLLWSKIDEKLNVSTRSNNYGWIWKAAAVLLLGVSSVLMYQKSKLQDKVNQTAETTLEETIIMDTDFEETEVYYTAMIEEKKMEIASFQVDDPELKAEFEADLEELDVLYLELKEELFETSNEKVMEALIDNLRLRINILNRQLDILEKIKNYQNEDAPKLPSA